MANKMIRLLGVAEFSAQLNKIKNFNKVELGKALELTIFKMQRDIQQDTPVKDGILKSGYAVEIDKPKLRAEVFNRVIYGPFVEFGTSKMAAQPHFVPNVEKNIGFWHTSIERAYNKAVRRAGA